MSQAAHLTRFLLGGKKKRNFVTNIVSTNRVGAVSIGVEELYGSPNNSRLVE